MDHLVIDRDEVGQTGAAFHEPMMTRSDSLVVLHVTIALKMICCMTSCDTEVRLTGLYSPDPPSSPSCRQTSQWQDTNHLVYIHSHFGCLYYWYLKYRLKGADVFLLSIFSKEVRFRKNILFLIFFLPEFIFSTLGEWIIWKWSCNSLPWPVKIRLMDVALKDSVLQDLVVSNCFLSAERWNLW